jgi:hypothetical protein
MHFSSLQCVLYVPHFILLDLVILKHLVKNTNYEVSHYVILSVIPFFLLFGKILSAPPPETSSIYVIPSECKIKFHTHTKI